MGQKAMAKQLLRGLRARCWWSRQEVGAVERFRITFLGNESYMIGFFQKDGCCELRDRPDLHRNINKKFDLKKYCV
jgi:hypothetical protein